MACLTRQLRRPLARTLAATYARSARPASTTWQLPASLVQRRCRTDAQRERELLNRRAAEEGAVPVYPFLAGGVLLAAWGWYDGFFEPRTSKGEQMVAWLEKRKVKVVVFEVDGVMSCGSSPRGVPTHYLDEYLEDASTDFIEAVGVLTKKGFHLAVATKADPSDYKKLGVSTETHLIGADLAKVLLSRRCPGVLSRFGIMVGFDPKSHGNKSEELGKRHHLRQIAEHYRVRSNEMVLFDCCQQDLENEDGWIGVLVRDKKLGFQYEDCLKALP